MVTGDRCKKGVKPVNWILRISYQITDVKARLSSVLTKNKMSDQIIHASHIDYTVSIRLAGVIDLIAAEA